MPTIQRPDLRGKKRAFQDRALKRMKETALTIYRRNCPVLTGYMKSRIKAITVGPTTIRIVVETAYASFTNARGSSAGWATRSQAQSVTAINGLKFA